MKCVEIREKLADYSVELLDARTSGAVDAHLDICDECRRELRTLNAVMSLVETHGFQQPPVGLFNGVRNRIEAERVTQQRPAWWAFLFSAPARAAAMTLAVGALALGLFLPVDPGTPPPPGLPIHPSSTGVPLATTALAGSIRQHALSAGDGPLTDRVAWEAVAQLVTPDNPDGDDSTPDAPAPKPEVR